MLWCCQCPSPSVKHRKIFARVVLNLNRSVCLIFLWKLQLPLLSPIRQSAHVLHACVDISSSGETQAAHMSRSLLQMTAASSHMTCCRRLRLVADAVCFLTDRSEGLLNAQMNHAACLIQSPRVLQHACMCVTVSCHATSEAISPQPTHKRPHNTDYLYPTVWNYINSLGCRCSVAFFYLPCLTECAFSTHPQGDKYSNRALISHWKH